MGYDFGYLKVSIRNLLGAFEVAGWYVVLLLSG
jgi:hypothetical protein